MRCFMVQLTATPITKSTAKEPSMFIINLTQHEATPDQKTEGVVDLPAEQRKRLGELLTFEELPGSEEIQQRADAIVALAAMNGLGGDADEDPWPTAAMVGGAPWLMPALCTTLNATGIKPLFAFSTRESTEALIDGQVVKASRFVHRGFIAA